MVLCEWWRDFTPGFILSANVCSGLSVTWNILFNTWGESSIVTSNWVSLRGPSQHVEPWPRLFVAGIHPWACDKLGTRFPRGLRCGATLDALALWCRDTVFVHSVAVAGFPSSCSNTVHALGLLCSTVSGQEQDPATLLTGGSESTLQTTD